MPPPPSKSSADGRTETEIEDVVRRYFNAFEGRDRDAMGEVFAPDACFMANGIETLRDRVAIQQLFERIFDLSTMTCEELRFERIVELGDGAFAEVRTRECIQSTSDGAVQSGEYRELFCLRRDREGWRIVSYMGNRPVR